MALYLRFLGIMAFRLSVVLFSFTLLALACGPAPSRADSATNRAAQESLDENEAVSLVVLERRLKAAKRTKNKAEAKRLEGMLQGLEEERMRLRRSTWQNY